MNRGIISAGDNVSPGYLQRPDLTAQRFVEVKCQRAYRTGDVGHIQDGLVFFDGRRDHQVKLHGHRVELVGHDAYKRLARRTPGRERSWRADAWATALTFHAVCFGFLIFSGRLIA